MKKLLIIDRDGTLIKEPKDQQIDAYEKLEFLPQVISALRKIEAELDYELIMLTNQDGLGTKDFPENKFWPVHNLMLKTFENEDVNFKDVLIDKSFAKENHQTESLKRVCLKHILKVIMISKTLML